MPKIIVGSVIGLMTVGGAFIGCRETEEQRMERRQDEESKKLLKILDELYEEIVSSNDLPEDIQAAELNEQVKAFAIAYAYDEIFPSVLIVRSRPVWSDDLMEIPGNVKAWRDEPMHTRELSLLKVKEGIDVAVTMYQRKGKAIPRVITNDAGAPVIEGD